MAARIIVGVKYCFRYNARNRAIRNGEDVDPIRLDNMPARPHRRRREKKLMTMDEVNERFPLTKYKNWVASRAREGLPTAGGVTAPPSRAGSVHAVDGAMPASPTGTKHSVMTRPDTADPEAADVPVSLATNAMGGAFGSEHKRTDAAEEGNGLEEVRTTASTVDRHAKVADDEDEDDDDHIHTALPPELLTNPGDSCAICIDTLEDDDDIRGLTCGHAFHAGCLDPWLTSRRACCPLCKADYFTPKPRPEGEAAEVDRVGRRRDPRMNLPAAPQSAWTGIRGTPRLMLPGRFGSRSATYPGNAGGLEEAPRRVRRARRAAAAEAAAVVAQAARGNGWQEGAGAVNSEEAAAPRRWVPRIANPFGSMSMPTMRLPGRNRATQEASAEQATDVTGAEPSPSQLEAGIVR